MSADILVVGQGVAGTLLAWELERAGVGFAIADAGPEYAASNVAAGLINPITGRRLVKSARVDTLLPAARNVYRELEAELGAALWREVRIRRVFSDERERRVVSEKGARGDLAPFLGTVDEAGCWIEGAAQVDLSRLLAAARARWRRQGRLREERFGATAASALYECVVECSGAAAVTGGGFGFVPWEYSKGELLEIEVAGLAPDTVLNDGHWVLPIADGVAWVGATHEPGVFDREPTAAGRAILEAAASRLLQRPFRVLGQRAGARVNLPDKRPVAGRHPSDGRLGLINGLGAKGALWAPTLARQWVDQWCHGLPIEAEIDVARFALKS